MLWMPGQRLVGETGVVRAVEVCCNDPERCTQRNHSGDPRVQPSLKPYFRGRKNAECLARFSLDTHPRTDLRPPCAQHRPRPLERAIRCGVVGTEGVRERDGAAEVAVSLR